MTKEDHILEVVQAFKDGAEIEWQSTNYGNWCPAESPKWDWENYDYRIKPKEPARWKPNNEDYWYLAECGTILDANHTKGSAFEDLYRCGNCFRTKEQAETARDIIKQALADYHESIVNSKGSR